MYETNAATKVADSPLTLPSVKGYKILIAMPKVKEKNAQGVYLPPELLIREELASIVGNVLALGDLCYKDPVKFPTGAWCGVGDWVVFRSYAGTRFKIRGQEFRCINDDSVEAVIDDPSEIVRAGA